MSNSYRRVVSKLVGVVFGLGFALQAVAQNPSPAGSLRGTVTDPSGARVPNALVQLVGPQTQQRRNTDGSGQYSFPTVAHGVYLVRVIAKDFTLEERTNFAINGPLVLDVQLHIEAS